jgi:predicted aspartyl protease
LPIAVAVSLGLELIDTTDTELADGTVVEDELVFAGQVEWDGTMMDVDILLTRSADVLIGTAFFMDHVVQLDYKANSVRIESVPS